MGASDDGTLKVTLGGVDATTVRVMSGGGRGLFTSLVTVQFELNMQSERQAMVRIDGTCLRSTS
jgi:hypothetical protein